MADQSEVGGVEVNRALLMSGVVLLSGAALLGALGGIAVTVAMVGAARTWVNQWEEPPSVLARRRLAQARAAAIAGAQGWTAAQQQGGDVTSNGGPLSSVPHRQAQTGGTVD
jgi:hypothetical protein